MNFDRLIRMVLNIFMRKAISKGVNKGIDLAAGKGKPREEMTPEERKMARQARQGQKRARQARRAARHLKKF